MRVQSEHARAHDLGADAVEVRRGVVVVQARGARAGLAEHALAHRPGRGVCRDQAVPVLADRILRGLIGRGRVAVERDVQIDAYLAHWGSSLWVTADAVIF